MFNYWKGVIKVVKERSPTLIFRRLPKADRVILKSFPLDEEEILVLIFNASLQLMRNVPVHGRNNGLGVGE